MPPFAHTHAISNSASAWISLFFFQAEDGIRDYKVTGVQTCALPISFDFLGGGPFYFDEVDDGGFAEAEVEAEVGLGHDTGAGMDFVHLGVSAGDDADAGADGAAVARGADRFEFDPVLRVASAVA